MTFPSSGAISASVINAELGKATTATLGLNDSDYRNRVLKVTGAISYADAYEFVLTIGTAPTTANVREPSSGAAYSGWGGTDWRISSYYNDFYIWWGGSQLLQTQYSTTTSWTTGNTTYYRDSLQWQEFNGYGIYDHFALYRITSTFNLNGLIDPDIRQLAVNAGWNQNMRLVVVLRSGSTVSSSSTGSPAMNFTGSFPNGVVLINNGNIHGMGGAGGNTTAVGNPGGPAITSSTTLRIYNYGTIAGGGGGGGAGVYWVWNGLNRSTPGSGGASGHLAAAGGGGGPNTQGAASYDGNSDGRMEVPGPSNNWGWGGRASSPGGKGGSWGAAGDAGGTVDGNYNYSGYAGGAGGKSVNVTGGTLTWGATGTIYGAY